MEGKSSRTLSPTLIYCTKHISTAFYKMTRFSHISPMLLPDITIAPKVTNITLGAADTVRCGEKREEPES
jgi:hypothetical protein